MKKYIPIQVESLSKKGKWQVRNSFNTENSKVRSSAMSRTELGNLAQRWMVKWIINYDHAATLRVSGLPKSYFSKENEHV